MERRGGGREKESLREEKSILTRTYRVTALTLETLKGYVFTNTLILAHRTDQYRKKCLHNTSDGAPTSSEYLIFFNTSITID